MLNIIYQGGVLFTEIFAVGGNSKLAEGGAQG